jgi:dTDP-4-amino-4,6-dideoxygalactose transaminase
LHRARIVFIDIRPDTLNIDESLLERHISPNTKAIVPVHYAGVGCEMDTIMEIAENNGLSVIEDNAHGLFGSYHNRLLGTFGSLAALSFHETKNVTCGEGGALLINNEEYIERAEIIREKGTNRSRFFRGQIDKYTWVDIGSSYLPSDVLGAILLAQLEARDQIQSNRRRVWQTYYDRLKDWALEHEVRLPDIPPYCQQPYHMFYLIMPSESLRDQLIKHLKARGILSVFHYLPLHLSEQGKTYGTQYGDCPVTEDISKKLVRLPFYSTLNEQEQEEVIEAVFSSIN